MSSSLPPKVRDKIRRALRTGRKPLEIARRLNLPLLTIAALIAEHGWPSGAS